MLLAASRLTPSTTRSFLLITSSALARVTARDATAARQFRRAAAPSSPPADRRAIRAFAVRCMSTKRMAPTKIGTHDGSFHCDEALGCHLLRLTKAYADATIVRTRDQDLLSECDIVIDVGATYEPEKFRFDHHQKGFEEVFGHGHTTKLSSAGLVYKHFGREIVANVLKKDAADPIVEKIYLKVYKSFVECVDGVDNGVQIFESDKPALYVDNTGLSARVGKFNANWNEPFTDETQMAGFEKAMALAGGEFEDAVRYYGEVWHPARAHVIDALDAASATHASGEILKLETFCPWKEHLFELEEERGMTTLPKYVLYDDGKGSWRVQAIPETPSSFNSRRGLPKAWRGVRDDALSELSGIDGCIFVHAAGFIGGNKTYDGALAMASKALELE